MPYLPRLQRTRQLMSILQCISSSRPWAFPVAHKRRPDERWGIHYASLRCTRPQVTHQQDRNISLVAINVPCVGSEFIMGRLGMKAPYRRDQIAFSSVRTRPYAAAIPRQTCVAVQYGSYSIPGATLRPCPFEWTSSFFKTTRGLGEKLRKRPIFNVGWLKGMLFRFLVPIKRPTQKRSVLGIVLVGNAYTHVQDGCFPLGTHLLFCDCMVAAKYHLDSFPYNWKIPRSVSDRGSAPSRTTVTFFNFTAWIQFLHVLL